MLVVLLLFLQSTLQDAASGDESSLWSSVVTVAAVLFVMLTVLAQTRHRLRSAKAKKGLGAEFLALARRLQQSNTQNAADEDALSAHEMREVDLELIRVFSITCRESLEKNFAQPLSLTSVEEQHFFMASLNISNLQIESFRQFYNSLDKDSS